jgi:hypothetical protein
MNDPANSDSVTNTKHGFVFHHTFNPTDWENSLNGLAPRTSEAVENFAKLRNMYQRRIERFNRVMNSGSLINLFRYEGINQDNAEKLYSFLKEKYPLSNFILVCIDEYYKRVNTLQSSNQIIHYFYLNPTNRPITDTTLENSHECFTKVFSELGLLTIQ